MRTAYPLNAGSIVFDLGGYKGEWAEKIFQEYGAYIYIFEPIEKFTNLMQEKFKGNSKIKIFNFGLSDRDGEVSIKLSDDASGAYARGENVQIKLRDIKKVIDELGLKKIDLIKLNIEGGEFQVLPRLIETGLVLICQDIQVQFHHFYPEAEKLREVIRRELEKTHHLTYDYPFTFENWRKNA